MKIPIPGSGFHTLGLSMTSMMELSNPNDIPVIAPVELKRFQYIVQRMIGKLALAAIPSARTERKATFIDCANKASRIEMTATPTEANRATSTCCFPVIFPSLMISPYISCAKADADVKTRPDTTAKIVANATAETNANKNSPPMVNARVERPCFQLGLHR